MKVLGVILGLVAAWALGRWAPQAVATVVGTSGFSGLLGAAVVALTSSWAIALNRLSSLEKLDDLSREQKRSATDKSRRFRKGILRVISLNSVTLVLGLISVPLGTSALKYHLGAYNIVYVLLPFLGLWLGGFVQSIRVLHNIDDSRIAIAETQAIEKQRNAYIQKMRDDEKRSPVDRNDRHLNNYTSDSHRLQH